MQDWMPSGFRSLSIDRCNQVRHALLSALAMGMLPILDSAHALNLAEYSHFCGFKHKNNYTL